MNDYDIDCLVAVFDVDGVLLESDWYHGVRPREIGVNVLRELLAKGYRVYIVSGRPEARRGETLDQLRKAGIPIERLAGVMLDRWGVGERASKLRNIEAIMLREGCIGEVHDDNPEVLSSVGRRAHALLLHGPWGCEAVKGHSASTACMGSKPLRAHW